MKIKIKILKGLYRLMTPASFSRVEFYIELMWNPALKSQIAMRIAREGFIKENVEVGNVASQKSKTAENGLVPL